MLARNLLHICRVSYLSIIQEKLRQVKHQLAEKYHVNSIGLFGSIVRSDFKPESDIDIMVEFSQPIGIEFIDLADDLEKLPGGLSFEQFLADGKTLDAVVRNFEIIGEAANRLPEEIKEQYPNIDWHRIRGSSCTILSSSE